ncbi:DUF2164 domain-containing protein [Jeotgalibacillus soli]|uniref:DUF2164 domain-containing protein n=1 Tax=Jeotgalibacillus soli TaxID=889306 RepID=A0A0C2VT59_9BACL|nr:DUF2164 domain-containing protein [Jeotgalibacillus soli]KIL52112.1 hypothetical protein KP78_04820 [Jeotgalibacillus soli]
MKDKFSFTAAEKKEMTKAIQTYFQYERDEVLGDLAASLLLDFILHKIGPAIYNKGVADAHEFLKEKLEDVFELHK